MADYERRSGEDDFNYNLRTAIQRTEDYQKSQNSGGSSSSGSSSSKTPNY